MVNLQHQRTLQGSPSPVCACVSQLARESRGLGVRPVESESQPHCHCVSPWSPLGKLGNLQPQLIHLKSTVLALPTPEFEDIQS